MEVGADLSVAYEEDAKIAVAEDIACATDKIKNEIEDV